MMLGKLLGYDTGECWSWTSLLLLLWGLSFFITPILFLLNDGVLSFNVVDLIPVVIITEVLFYLDGREPKKQYKSVILNPVSDADRINEFKQEGYDYDGILPGMYKFKVPDGKTNPFIHTLMLKLEALIEVVVCYAYVKAGFALIPLSVAFTVLKFLLALGLCAGVFLLWVKLNSKRYEKE